MTYRIPLLVAAPLLLVASGVAMANTAQLSVGGTITPGAACTVTLGSTAMDLGTIHRGMLNPDPAQPTKLDEQRVKTAVNCPSARRYAFVVTEAGGTDAAHPLVFDMRADDDGGTPGKLFLLFDAQSTQIEGKQGYATGSNEGTSDLGHATWGPSTPSRENLPITNGRYAVGFVTAENSTDVPVSIKDLSVDLLVRPQIDPTSELNLADDIGFASDLGLEIRYF